MTGSLIHAQSAQATRANHTMTTRAACPGSVYPVRKAEHDRDAELMLRVRDGDDASFALLVQFHRDSVVHFLSHMVDDQAVAEELAQEAFLRVYRSRSTYEPSAKFTTWLFRIVTHLGLNAIRDGRNERCQERLDAERDHGASKQIADHGRTIEQILLAAVRLDEIRRAVAELPAKQRAAVLMHKYKEMDYSQIAQALGCSESAVKSLLFRAYERLRVKLAHLA